MCNVGARAVQSSRQRVAAAHERGQLLPAASVQRGWKHRMVEITASSQGHDEDVQEQMDDEQGISVAFKAVGYDAVHVVAGRYVQGSEGSAENHAIALVLGLSEDADLAPDHPDALS